MGQLRDENHWSPYVAGAFTGLVLVLSVWISGNYLGASTSFVRSAGMIEKMANPEHVAQIEYFVKTTPKIDWQWMVVLGILFGSFIASKMSGTFKFQAVPDMWQGQFGPSITLRAFVAFFGGILAMFGARLADG